ncbi:uncharacterized protein plekhg6 isoform X1 [Xyrichtys novacula]|uniref:Uncharacterized protein plekhg6 isoform X1 n=1 Tax=Xyrichtys novacula TaxID=13765 RepID=A0AAV1FMY2_XYRNO|nr:uncharacterized protein plekhg6 isoform X1 [Xyrichtys novacula]
MDPTKPSLSSKAPHVNNGGGNESLMEESAWREGVDGERQRDTNESRETDVVDGTTAAAETNQHHWGSADKSKFNTTGFQRRTKQKVVTDFATVSKGTSAGAKPRAALRQVLFSQGVSEKNSSSEERGQLDVLKQGLESFAVPASLKWKWNEENLGTTLEKSWTEIVHSHSTMSRMQRHQQEALWEFVHTELTYINKLIIIRDLVIAALVNLHQRGFLVEMTPKLLFSNLPSIISAHQLFWQEVIYPMLQEVRKTGKPFDPMRLEAGCLQFHERFSSYQYYCWEEENNLEFTRRQMESNPHFLAYVQWVETHPQCDRMRLGDMQAKPHQRITKYPLLLKAILKTTQDPQVQHALRGMLSNVISFLESINDYLRLKDEELALAISAQRVEGYEVEGINEDIDKLVREITQFDLTCPIRGVGPEVVRKLMLEENLKIRGRKDSKLEVVALLFSDVLLMTKVQKKGERLKVVRPPLALDRTYCIPLKDGCSFVVVEVGELQSAMNVYIFVASTPESCSKWVITIQQAKEKLKDLRETERIRQLQKWKPEQLEDKPVTDTEMNHLETDEEPHVRKRGETFVEELTEELIQPQSVNGMLASREAEEQREHPDDFATSSTRVPFFQSLPAENNQTISRKGFAGRQQPVQGYEWIEMGVRREQFGMNPEEERRMIHLARTKKGKFLGFDHRVHSAPNLDHFRHTVVNPSRYNTTGPHALLIGGYPDIDYPMDEETSIQTHQQTNNTKEEPELVGQPEEGGTSARTDADPQFVKQDIGRNFIINQSGDLETSTQMWGFSKNLKSPGLRRRRPVSTHQGVSTQVTREFFQEAPNNFSFHNADSRYNGKMKRNSLPVGHSADTLRVLKLGSLKSNQGMFWEIQDRYSPDPQTLSESELPDPDYFNPRPIMKTKRSASIPNIIIQGDRGLRLHSSGLNTLPLIEDTQLPPSEDSRNGQASPLEGLLERAKERGREKGGLKRNRYLKVSNLRSGHPPPSPSFSTTPSPPPSDGDRDTEWEEEVEVMRHRALTVSQGWKEQLVDGDEDGKRDSVIFADGVNVDWSGWCFDDEEVMDHLQPEMEGLLEGISRSLAFGNLYRLSEQDDAEISQV